MTVPEFPYETVLAVMVLRSTGFIVGHNGTKKMGTAPDSDQIRVV